MARLVAVCFAAIFACLLLTEIVSTKSIARIRRALPLDSSATTSASIYSKICSKSEACGWEIYDSHHVAFDFMTNTCRCPENSNCVRVADDISVSAYVHKCSPKIPDPNDNNVSP